MIAWLVVLVACGASETATAFGPADDTGGSATTTGATSTGTSTATASTGTSTGGTGDPCDGWPDPIAADVNCGPAPLEVHFDGSSLAAGFGSGCAWQEVEWDFGDGGASTEVDPVHVYEEPGDHQVRAVGTVLCPAWEASADLVLDQVRAW